MNWIKLIKPITIKMECHKCHLYQLYQLYLNRVTINQNQIIKANRVNGQAKSNKHL